MIDAQSSAALIELARRISNSMLQYIHDSNPLNKAEYRTQWAAIVDLIDEERDMLGRIVRLLRKHRIAPPGMGSYPMSFTTINYMPIPHLVSLLVTHQKNWVAELEARSTPPADDEAKALAAECKDMAKRHLQTLEELNSKPAIEQPA